MALDPKLLEILACPEDKGPLLYFADEDTLYNPRLKRRYRVLDGDIPDLLIDDAETVDDAEHARLTKKAETDGIEPNFAAADSLNFLDAVAGLPEQLAAAHEAAAMVPADALPKADPIRNIVVLGHGRLRASRATSCRPSFNDELPVPVSVLKQIRTPAYVGPNTLAFAMSYSGDTEETISMARSAVERGAQLVAVSCGGELEALARDAGALHMRVPVGLPAARRGRRAGRAAVHGAVPARARAGRARAADARAGAAGAPARRVPPGGRRAGEPGA